MFAFCHGVDSKVNGDQVTQSICSLGLLGTKIPNISRDNNVKVLVLLDAAYLKNLFPLSLLGHVSYL